MRAILKKEIIQYFHTSIAYIFIGMFMLLAGLLYGLINLANLSSDIPGFLAQFSIVSVILTPVLTMRMFCKEFHDATHKLLFSAPIRTSDIVLGKFWAGAAIIFVSIALSLLFILVTAIYGRVFFAETLLAYIGLFLLCILFLAIDMFVSSFAKKQITAIVFCFGINLILWFLDLLANSSTEIYAGVLRFVSPYQRLRSFLTGQLSYANIAYFLLLSSVFVLATINRLNVLMFGGLHENR